MVTKNDVRRFLLVAICWLMGLIAAPAVAAGMSAVEFCGLCETGTLEQVETAIRNGADVNARNDDGETALMLAAGYNGPEVVSALLRAGADVNAHNADVGGSTALIYAATTNIANPKVFSILLEAGAEVDAKYKNGETALIRAAPSATPEVLSVLLNAGADVNAQTREGGSALMGAAQWNKPEAITLLIEAGAYVNLLSKNGRTALDAARMNINPEVYRTLFKASGLDEPGYLTVIYNDSGEHIHRLGMSPMNPPEGAWSTSFYLPMAKGVRPQNSPEGGWAYFTDQDGHTATIPPAGRIVVNFPAKPSFVFLRIEAGEHCVLPKADFRVLSEIHYLGQGKYEIVER